LFFVLSGYLLTSHLQNQELTVAIVGNFYLRRVLRIYPAVWLQIAILLPIAWAFPHVYTNPPWHSIVLNIMLWVNLPPFFEPVLNDVWWTLPVELLFYVSLPLLLLLRRQFSLTFVIALLLTVTFGWRGLIINRYAGQNLSTQIAILDSLPGVMTSFGAGFVAASIQHRISPECSKSLLKISAIAFVCVQILLASHIQSYWRGGWLLLIWNSMLAVSMIGIVLAVCLGAEASAKHWLSSRSMVWLGDLSFGIYLWHYPVLQVLAVLWPQTVSSMTGSLLVLALLIPMTLGLAAASYYLLEKRAMHLV
jgi:peptidoglycan/LPS O-acetylase OafA/YrhL